MAKRVNSISRLKGEVKLPPDKSISHRSAMFAALADGQSVIKNYSQAADPQSTLQCLKQLGVSIEKNDSTVVVEGVGRDGLIVPSEDLDCGNSGTTMRLLSGIVGGAGIKCTLTGDESLSNRTMQRIINPLQAMGVEMTARDGDYAPINFQGTDDIQSLNYKLPIASAQLKSCVLLTGLFGDEPTTVIETKTSRDHTERLLQLPVEHKDGKKIISSDRNCSIPNQSYQISGDFSSAAYWLVAASVHPEASITLRGVGVNPTRTGALHILQKMGANIRVKNKRMEGAEPVADVYAESSTLQPIEIGEDLVPNCIDELPILLIAMLFAEGKSTIKGAQELRHKETDRLSAMAKVLEVAGATFEEKKDGFVVQGGADFNPKGGTFESFGDHRIAMSSAVLALLSDGTSQVTEANCTAISYPGFWEDLETLK